MREHMKAARRQAGRRKGEDMNELKIFNYEGTAVRTIEQNGEVWWVLADVCRVLTIENARNVAARLDDDEKGVRQMDTPGGPQQMTTISESGLYKVAFRSDKPEAKKFTRWVTHEVLPAIRKTGAYTTTEADPHTRPPKAASVGEVAQLLRVLRPIMKDNYQPPDIIAETALMVCAQFGIQLPEDFVNKPLPSPQPAGLIDWRPWEDDR